MPRAAPAEHRGDPLPGRRCGCGAKTRRSKTYYLFTIKQLDTREISWIMCGQCQPRSPTPACPLQRTKGLVRAASGASAARCAASLPAASLSPANSGARRRNPVPVVQRPGTWHPRTLRPQACRSRPGGRAPHAGRQPPHRFGHPSQPGPAGSRGGSAASGASPRRSVSRLRRIVATAISPRRPVPDSPPRSARSSTRRSRNVIPNCCA